MDPQEMTATTVLDAPQDTTTLASTLTYELSFNTANGTFTLTQGESSQTNSILRSFEIEVTEPSTLIINAQSPLAFSSTHGTDSPFAPLPVNTAAGLTLTEFSPSSIEIAVAAVPAQSAVLGFQLYTLYTTSGGSTIECILTPSFFVTQGTFQPQTHALIYVPENGEFRIAGAGLNLPVTKDTILLRLGNANGHQGGDIWFTLSGAQFADPPAIVTPSGAAEVAREALQLLRVRSAFHESKAFGLSFAVVLDGVTILSPDPIIVDKEIGSGGT